MSSILEPLRRQAEQRPDKLLYAFLDIDGRVTSSYTFAQFVERVEVIAAHLHRSAKLEQGARVLLVYPPGLEMICALFACARIGLIPVPAYPPSSHGFAAALHKLTFIARDCGAAAVLTERSLYWSMRVNRARHQIATRSLARDELGKLRWILSDEARGRASPPAPERHSDILFLQYTSGSTSDPKGVMVTHDNVLANCRSVVDHMPVGVSWLPQYHDMGLLGYYIYFALEGGTTYGFSPLDFIRRPALWLETISAHAGTASSAPNFAFEYCLRPGKIPEATYASLDLSSLRFLMIAAEPVRARVYREFLARFEPRGLRREAFFSAYGLAEYTLAVSNYGRTVARFDAQQLRRDRATPVAEANSEGTAALVSCGVPLGDTQIAIVDRGRALPDGAVGEIWVRGASKCAGYWGRPAQSREVFEARLDAPGDDRTWLRTGDLGFVRDGELYICGRSKDLIIVRGLNYHPQDIEALVEQQPQIRQGGVAAFAIEAEGAEQLVVIAELHDHTQQPDARAINQLLRERLGLPASVLVWIPARTIPKTSSGKIARQRARQRWCAGELEIIAELRIDAGEPATRGEHEPASGFVALFERYQLDRSQTQSLGELGLDSVELAELAHDLQVGLGALGDSELGELVDLRLLQKLAVSELFELCEQLQSAAPRAKLYFRQAFARLRDEHRSGEQAMMRADARLGFELPAKATAASTTGRAILLTGGTGFLGPFLLRSLLAQRDEDIYVLIRAADPDQAMRRLIDGFGSLGELAPTPGWARRVHPLCGDLARPNLGLSPSTWAALRDNIGVIFHNGAQVNYLLDYASLRDANVGGTRELIRLAAEGPRAELNYVSTTFVFGWSSKATLFEADCNREMELLDFGYSQSKWVAEQLVLEAMAQGLGARIFRPALISPSVAGHGYNFDIAIRLLAFMLDHQLTTTAQNQVSFSPADLVADNIVAIAGLPDTLGETLHVTRDDHVSMLDITNLMSELSGRSFEPHALADFVPEVVSRCQKHDLLFPLLNFLVRSIDNITAMEFKRYDNSNYRRARDRARQARADPPLREVVGGILRFMDRHGLGGGRGV